MIRTMEPGDIDRIVLLEQDGLSPWERDALVREIGFEAGVQFIFEGEKSGEILGWCCSRWLDTEAELLKMTEHMHRITSAEEPLSPDIPTTTEEEPAGEHKQASNPMGS